MCRKSFIQYINEFADERPRDLSSYEIVKPGELYRLKTIYVPGVGHINVRVPHREEPTGNRRRKPTDSKGKSRKPGRDA